MLPLCFRPAQDVNGGTLLPFAQMIWCLIKRCVAATALHPEVVNLDVLNGPLIRNMVCVVRIVNQKALSPNHQLPYTKVLAGTHTQESDAERDFLAAKLQQLDFFTRCELRICQLDSCSSHS